jgi:hypothetical protein
MLRTFAHVGNSFMKNTETTILIEEIDKTEKILAEIRSFYKTYKTNDQALLGKGRSAGIILAEILTDYYTCLETLFLRISRHFENNLQTDRWHADLLHKMTLKIEGTRIPVITDLAGAILEELLRFRHFRRYYFQFDYDWDKLEYLEKKFLELENPLRTDLNRFKQFLADLQEDIQQ